MLTVESFFDLSTYYHRDLFAGCTMIWDALKSLKSYMDEQSYPECLLTLQNDGEPLQHTVVYFNETIIDKTGLTIEFGDAPKAKLKVYKNGELLSGASVIMAGASLIGGKIKLGQGVLIESGAFVKSPAIIGDNTEIRQGAYLRGYCLTGARCVVGHVTETKHTIFLDDAKAGHFAYLGDSILGNQVNLGAGTKLANLRFTPGGITIKTPDGHVQTGLRKFGAILGDNVQTGCNSVTNPGTLLGKKSMVLPNTTVASGYHANGSLVR